MRTPMKTLRALLLTLAVAAIPAVAQTITTTSLPDGNQNVQYSAGLTCTNCISADVWGIASGLPPGLGINTTSGVISGDPTAAGTFTFAVTLGPPTDPTEATAVLSITILAPLTNLTPSFPNGTVGVVYPTHKLAASGGLPPYTWSISPVSGPLPPGLGISGVTIGGTPTAAGTYPFTLLVTDSQNNTSPANFSITIVAPLAVTVGGLPTGTLNVNYTSQTLTASGGLPGYSWSVSSGSLPAGLGLTVTESGTVISGVPTSAGTFNFTLTVTDTQENTASAASSITIVTGAAITTASLPSGIVGQTYSAQLNCSACTGYVWSLSSGTLPPVLSLSSSGAITGTASTAGTYPFVVSLTLSEAPTRVTPVTQSLSITISPPLTITASTLPVATVNKPYTATVAATGGAPPYTWSFTSTANGGVTINSATGVISGTPTSGGQYTLGAMVTDSSGQTSNRLFTFFVASTLSVGTTSLPNGTVGTVYPMQTLSANGGQAPFRWTIPTGSLPPGLTLNGTQGTIAGTPTTAGAYPFTLMVTDTLTNTATANFTIAISAGVTITITPTALPGGTVGTAYSQVLTAAGGAAPYTWALLLANNAGIPGVGALPAGLTLNSATGVISGSPTAAGTSNFAIQATDKNGATGQASFSIAITAVPLSITTTTLGGATVGTTYTQTLAATGGQSPYSWAVAAGTLPAGLTLNATTGAISGSPTTAGTSSFTVTVTDSANSTAKQPLSIVVTALLTATPSTLPAATVGVLYNEPLPLAVSGGTPPYSYALSPTNTNGTVISSDGLTINSSTGAISGTPTAAGQFTLTIVVSDSAAPEQKTAQNLALTVNSAAPPTATLTGVPATSGFDQQLSPTLSISAAYPANITGTITLTFAPSVTPPAGSNGAIDDLMIQFSSGSRTIDFTIPAGSTTASLTNASSITVLTGTTAGTITLTTTLTANNQTLGSPTTQTIVNNAGVPFISKVTLQQVPSGISVTIVGFSSTRDMTNAQIALVPATNDSFANGTVGSTVDVSVAVNSVFAQWWANTAQSNPYGTQFTLTIPLAFTTPAGSSISSVVAVSVTVTLANSKGASNPVTLSQ